MPRRKILEIKFRRRREAKTDYKKRLALVKGGMARVVIRKTDRRIIGQVIRYDAKGDVVTYSADSNELKGMGWPSRSNRSTAYLTGMLLASKINAKDKGNEFVLDIGLSSPVKNSIPFVFAKGCVDNGMKLKGKFEMDEKVYDFSMTAKYAEELKKSNAGAYNRQFGGYLKEKTAPEDMAKHFTAAKEKVRGSSAKKE